MKPTLCLQSQCDLAPFFKNKGFQFFEGGSTVGGKLFSAFCFISSEKKVHCCVDLETKGAFDATFVVFFIVVWTENFTGFIQYKGQ